MDDLACPRCKTTKYRNPALKLMVNVCGHALCDSCVELLFLKGSGVCPECGHALRRSGFRVQLFEDPSVEKEVEIRKRVLKDYTKRESDFSSLREYNDYLEEVETIIFNLVNNIDIIETNRQIEQYKKVNRDQINKSKIHLNPDLLELEEILEQERFLEEQRRYENVKLEKEEKLRKIKTREALIDDLMFSEMDAHSIVNAHKTSEAAALADQQLLKERDTKEILANRTNLINAAEQAQLPSLNGRQNQFSSGIRIGGAPSAIGVLAPPKVDEAPLYEYEGPIVFEPNGPALPTAEEIIQMGYLDNIRGASVSQKAGGHRSVNPCRRAIQDAFLDLCLYPSSIGRNIRPNEEMDCS